MHFGFNFFLCQFEKKGGGDDEEKELFLDLKFPCDGETWVASRILVVTDVLLSSVSNLRHAVSLGLSY